MAIYDRPDFFDPASMQWGILKSGVQFAGPYNGTPQALDFVADRWTVSTSLPPILEQDAGPVEAFAMLMAGGVNRVRLYHEARPVPVGTMRGNPTVASTITRGASVLPVNMDPGATLKAGDLVGASAHLFMVAASCVADGNGLANAQLVNRARATIAAGTPIVWNKPTALFVVPAFSMNASHAAIVMESLALDLVEVW